MKTLVSGRLLSGLGMLVWIGQAALAQQGAPPSSCRDVLAGSGGGARQVAYCEQRAAEARNDLAASGTNADNLSDADAIDRAGLAYDTRRAKQGLLGIDTQTPDEKRNDLRSWGVGVQGLSDAQVREAWNRETVTRSTAELQAARRAEEAEKLLSLGREDETDARNREIDAIAAQATQSAEGMRLAAEMAHRQGDAALRSLGVDPEALSSEDEDTADSEADAFEMRIYQQMIDSGMAPGCKDLKGDALVTCVDAVLDEQ